MEYDFGCFFCDDGREEKGTEWFGTKIVYHEPLLVAKFRVTDADNRQQHFFKVPQAETGGSIQLQIEISGFEKQRIKAVAIVGDMASIEPPWKDMTATSYYSLMFVPKNKDFFLATMCETQNPSLISVYLVSWNIL